MENQQEFVFRAGSSSFDKTKNRWVPAKKGDAGGSSDEADSVSSVITSEASSMLQSLAAAATSSATDISSDVSTPCSLLPFSAYSSSLSISHLDASQTTSPSVLLAVPKTASSESLVGNLPDAEKMQVVSAGESEPDHSDNVTTQKEKIQFLQLGAPVPNDVMNEKGQEKSQEISDPAPNLDASSSSLSVSLMDASKTTSPSVSLAVPKTASSESSAGNLPDAEKIQVVRAGESESDYSDNVTTQKEKIQFLQSNAPVPSDVMNEKGKGKSQEISDPAPNLPLSLIPISRVLKGMPQSPHFLPLGGFSELLREKLMAALDQTFEDTAGQIQSLTKANGFFWERAIDLWKTMGELELMGYNVILIRRRLVEITEVVVELEERKLTIVELKSQADYHRMEKNRLLNMILSLKNKVEWEELNKEQLLNKVDILEEELSKYDDLIASLAMKPFGINN